MKFLETPFDEYNSRLVEDMGLIEEEMVNLKAYEDGIQANVRIAYESLNKSYDSMKNLADIIEVSGYCKTGVSSFAIFMKIADKLNYYRIICAYFRVTG